LPGIGDRMVEHLEEIVKSGDYALRQKLLKNIRQRFWICCSCSRSDQKRWRFLFKKFKAGHGCGRGKAAKEEKLRSLEGFGEKSEQNILKAVEVFKKSTGRFHLNTAEDAAEKIIAHIKKAGKAAESVTPAGSLRRGKEDCGRSGFACHAGGRAHGAKARGCAGRTYFESIRESIRRWRTARTK